MACSLSVAGRRLPVAPDWRYLEDLSLGKFVFRESLNLCVSRGVINFVEIL